LKGCKNKEEIILSSDEFNWDRILTYQVIYFSTKGKEVRMTLGDRDT
jgi:hypothetical protein